MRYFMRLAELIAISCFSFLMVKESHGLPHDTQPRIVSRADLPNAPPAYDPGKDNYKRYVSKRCSPDQVASEARGWAEAGVLANAINAWKPKSDYQSAMDTYMGTDSSSNWGIFWSYRQRVQNAVTNDNKIHTDQQPSRTYIYVYCDEDDTPQQWEKACNGTTGAYTWDSLGYIWSNHYLVLCPNNFFDATITPTLSSQLRAIRDKPSSATDMMSLYWNLGSIYFHETFHWRNTVTNPRAMDSDPDDNENFIYGPQAVKDEATSKNTYANSVIADAYTMVATAMMLMQTFRLADPPLPLSVSAATTWTLPSFGDAPSDWVGAQNSSDLSSLPDMNLWQQSIGAQINMDDYLPISSSTPSTTAPTPKLTCNGDLTTKWMGRDALNNVIPTFCEDAEKQGVQDKDSASLVRSYNAGGVDAVTLSMDWPSGADFKPQKDDCVGFLTTVMDSCDGNDPVHNPLNWKHGGYNQVGDVRYNVFPTAQRYNAGTCSMHVHQEEFFDGVDGPGTSRSHTYYLRVDAKDSADQTVATVDNDAEAGDADPYHLSGYYNDLVMTPEAQGDYIQFALGDQYWRSTDEDGVPRCKVGGWDGNYSPVGRDMDCWFYC